MARSNSSIKLTSYNQHSSPQLTKCSISIHSNLNYFIESKKYFDRQINIHSNTKISSKTICTIILFLLILTIISIITVCLTQPPSNNLCQTKFNRIMNKYLSDDDSYPVSINAADLNHDNLIDIVIVNSGTNTIGIYFNYGNGTFSSQILYSTGNNSKPISVALADLNNDSHIDIAVANYQSHNIKIFVGYGNGNFSNEITFSTGISCPISIAVADLNNDYLFDIIITNNGTNSIGIYLGYGNGEFENEITYSTDYDSFPYFVSIADLNNDHYMDIVVANSGTNNIGIFFGYGNGNFKKQITYSTNRQSKPYSIAINDLNNDGQLDIAVANSGTNNIGIFFGYGNGSFSTQKTYPIYPGSHPCSIIIDDFNKDNQMDIAVSNSNSNNIGVLIGYGNGTFSLPTIHSTGTDSNPLGMISADFDNNNQSDIAIVNINTNNLIVFTGYTMMQSKYPRTYSTGIGSSPFYINTQDLNNDSYLDLIVTNSGSNNIGIFFGYGNGSFQQQITYSTGNNSHPYGLNIADIDHDYIPDIIIGNSNGGSLQILYGYGNRSFNKIISYSFQDFSTIMSIIIEDLNNDNHLDIAFVDYGTHAIGILFGYGNRTFKELVKYSSGNNTRPRSLSAGDFNNDGRLDIVVANHDGNSIGIFLGSNNDTFILFKYYSTGDGSLPYIVTIADLNKDNQLDIIVSNYGTSNVGIFFGFGNGSFHAQQIYSTDSNSYPRWVSVADFNNDDSLDIAIVNSGKSNIGILLGNGYGYFSNQTTYSTGSSSNPYSICIGDFNKDNRLDIAVANYLANNVAILLGHVSLDSKNENWINNNVSLLLGDYYSDFLNQITYPTGSSPHPYSIAIADLNNDTKMDIIVTNSGNDNIHILVGYNNGTFDSEIFYPTGIGSSPRSVIVNDFNNDNQLDIVISNSKTDNIILLIGNENLTFSTKLTYSTGLGSNPNSLAIGYFSNDKYLDLVVANEGTDTIGIFFGFNYTVFNRQNPYKTGNTSILYSIDIGDFNNDGHIDIVSALYSTDNMGLFLGYGNGTFTQMTTHAHVPSSHPWSIAVGDFNNDKQLDITLANWGINSISVVLGYGNGTFQNPILYSTGTNSRPVFIAVGDFNNDNYLDIITANFGGNSICVFIGYGNGNFRNFILLSTGIGSSPSAVSVSDINNDGKLDIIVANLGTNTIGIFLGYGNGTFIEQIIFSTGANTSPWSVSSGDFNKDGKLDLVVSNNGESSIGIYLGYGNGTFTNFQKYVIGIGTKPTNMYIGDFNNDNNLDIIVANVITDSTALFFGYGDGTFTTALIIPTQSSSAVDIVVYDFNNDNRLDFIITDHTNGNIHVFLANDSKPFGGQSTISVGEGSHPSSIALAHFNNDNQLDIAVANFGTNNIGIIFGYNNRMFSNMTTYSTGYGSYPVSLAIGDFNNDSITDIVVANYGTNNILVFIGYDNGIFSLLISYAMEDRSQPISIAVSHFNRDDDHLDIGIANFGANNICILYGFGNGTFINQTLYTLGYNSQPNSIIFKDINNDDWKDIAIVDYGTNDIQILLNLC